MSQKSSFRLAPGTLLALVAFMLFSISDACVRAMNGAVPPLVLCFIGCALGAIAGPFLFRTSQIRDFFVAKRPWRWWARGGLAVVGTLSSLVAFSRLPLSTATALIFLAPVLTAVTSNLILKERISVPQWAGFGLGLVGVLLVLRPELGALELGHLCGFICALCGVATSLLIRSAGDGEKPAAFYGGGIVAPLVISAPGFFMLDRLPEMSIWLPLAGYAGCGALASLLIIYALRRAPASHVALAQYSQLLWSALLGVVFFNVHIGALSAAGLVIIAIAGVLFTYKQEAEGAG